VPTYVELTFEKGDIVAIDGKPMTPAQVMEYLNKVAARTASAAPTSWRTATSA
jgi:argininosuccinate synthase